MTVVDPKIKEALESAVKDAGQSDGLARKLERWFEAIASGNEDISDRQSAHRHLELLYEETATSPKSAADVDFSLDDLLDDDSASEEAS